MAVSAREISAHTSPGTGTAASREKNNTLGKILAYEIGGNKLPDSFRESFYSELALLLEAGMNIKSGLDLIQSQQKKEKYRKLLHDISHQLTQGGRFSEVLARQKKFSPYEHFSIKIGEETGNMTEILKRLASFYNQKIQQRRALTGALTYPGIIMLTALLAVTFMLTYMVPLFKDIFLRMGGELPWLTQVIIDLSESFSSMIIAGLGTITLLITIHLLYRKREPYRKFLYSLLLNIPIIGKMISQTYLQRLIQSLSLLINSRVPITEALDLSMEMIRFYPIVNSLKKIRKDILQGKSLHRSMSEFPIYNSRITALVKVGEETNQLGSIFQKTSIQMEEELQHQAKMLGNALEPLIIIFLGFLVALILIAMYLPMFQLSTSIGM